MAIPQIDHAPQWPCPTKIIPKMTVSSSNSVSQWPSLKWSYRLMASYKIAIFHSNDSFRKLNCN